MSEATPVADAPGDASADAPADARGGPLAPSWRDAWLTSIAIGLAVLMTACGLALAFGWVSLERAMDVRALFR